MNAAAEEADTAEGVQMYRAQGKKAALKDVNGRVNFLIEWLKEQDASSTKEGEEDGKEKG